MADAEERQIHGLTIKIDRLLCVGFGDCIEAAPEAFEFDDQGIVTFKDTADQVERERLITACDVCPVDALSVFDETGERLVP